MKQILTLTIVIFLSPKLFSQTEIEFSKEWAFDGQIISSVSLGDINQDGISDFAIIHNESTPTELTFSIKIFYGGENISENHNIRLLPTNQSLGGKALFIHDIVTGNFNDDQYIDIAISFKEGIFENSTEFNSYNVEILWGDDENSFTNRSIINTNSFSSPIPDREFHSKIDNLGDLNNDSIDDIGILPIGAASGTENENAPLNEAWIFFGGNTLNDEPDIILPINSSFNIESDTELRPKDIINLCDINGDGNNDFAIPLFNTVNPNNFVSPQRGSVLIYFGGEDKIYSSYDLYVVPEQTIAPYQAVFGKITIGYTDIDNDTYNDVIFSNDINSSFYEDPENYYVLYGGTEVDSVLDQEFSLDLNLFGSNPRSLWFEGEKIDSFLGSVSAYNSQNGSQSGLVFSTFSNFPSNTNAVIVNTNNLLEEDKGAVKLVAPDTLLSLGFNHEYSIAIDDFTGDNNPEVILTQIKEIDFSTRESNVYMYSLGTLLTSSEFQNDLVSEFNLFQNYPNPFNPNTQISFELSNPEFVTLNVYDILGREIKTIVNGKLTNGTHSYSFDGSDLTSGVYIYSLKTNSMIEYRMMTLIK
ncbi:MAG: T9SS type A sorting domain-containing protein [Balneolaceae bacterium]|nr:T9SS type A sorting domain-containing protein [Balneolaceae bacterium]MBO6545068.1 T9SS type A sorting domain-containing protein [Balneolaceae bacterium]MBO6646464.1 T9SS type A sorting domain-containing protein [Balneolaceae bacterium]